MKKVFILYYFVFFISVLSLPNEAFSQNVGIGITNPTRAKLEVNGAVDYTTAIFGGESTGIGIIRNNPGIGFNNYYNGGNRYIANGYSGAIWLDAVNGGMYFDINGSGYANSLTTTGVNSMMISNAGNIGIGGVFPNAPLQFPNIGANRKIVLWESANNNNQFFGLGIEAGALRYSVAGPADVHRFYSGSGPSSSNLLMSIWGDRTVTIGDDGGGGKLGINLSSPNYTLHVRQAGGTGICLQESVFNTTWHLRAESYAGGTSNYLRLYHQGGFAGEFRMTGEYVWYSDRRLKKNIKNLPSLLDKVMRLRPVIYEMKKNNPGNNKTIGFIAQEVKPLFPELVFTNENREADGMEDIHALSYSGFGVIAIKAIQEQQQQLTEMRKEIDLLKEQNKMLLQLLNKKN
jgi:hypothetical protein